MSRNDYSVARWHDNNDKPGQLDEMSRWTANVAHLALGNCVITAEGLRDVLHAHTGLKSLSIIRQRHAASNDDPVARVQFTSGCGIPRDGEQSIKRLIFQLGQKNAAGPEDEGAD